MLIPIVMAGGLGARLWPLSRQSYPKQFISLIEGQSLFQHTLRRLSAFEACSTPVVLGNEQHRFLMAEQVRLSAQPASRIVLEPCFKGTAPALALGAMQVLEEYDTDALLLVLPADHMIKEHKRFFNTLKAGIKSAQAGKLVAFGVVPTYPETGYGYIHRGDFDGRIDAYLIQQFVEKPDLRTAKNYFESQAYWWNSGIFLFSAATFLQELLLHRPQMYHVVKNAFAHAKRSDDFISPAREIFETCPSDSIDCAVMENTHNGVVLPLQSDWSDVGAWDSLAQIFEQDEQGNVACGDTVLRETRDCFVQATHRAVVTLGVKDLVIAETQDAVLVMEKSYSQEMKSVVAQLTAMGRKEITHHQRVHRPWGSFESIDSGERFQVKRITVEVGAKLSLQRHHHRSEHWVVVKGTARVTRGEDCFLLSENQSTYIPIGVDHRLENVGKIPLEIIEVQSGAYLGEDDIFRLEDQYGRSLEQQEEKENKATFEVLPNTVS